MAEAVIAVAAQTLRVLVTEKAILLSGVTDEVEEIVFGERGSSITAENQWWGRQTYNHQTDQHFVGMEEDVKKLVSLVVDNHNQCHRRHSAGEDPKLEDVGKRNGMQMRGSTISSICAWRDFERQEFFNRLAKVTKHRYLLTLVEMKQLRHLYLYGTAKRYTENGKLRFHGLTELETFVGLNSATDGVSNLSQLSKLWILRARIYDKDSLKVVIYHLNEKGQELKEVVLLIYVSDLVGSDEGAVLFRKSLMCGNLHQLRIGVEMNKFPEYEPQMLQNLVNLRLENNKMEEDPMRTLEMLPHLQHLLLESDAYLGKDMACHAGGFWSSGIFSL
ncbi:OLC1v1022303C1 [Oldenlandia corymbosa var. corymbosa]|uniref:OLC1v1022303C1 n=1 Tax=Oldenlandia corymbosa var. corymbosa TaxID=529605 RepID=A0AAV1BXK2_OLDCO|nr:OLC1v1022303C1 [Oldenlandia corymbosa var. corymbosa]